MGTLYWVECGRGRPRTSQGSAAPRCADLPVRNGLGARAGMRTRTSAHLAGFGGGVVRGPPGPQWAWCQSRNADEDVRAPRRVRRRRGARTSRSAMGLVPEPECGRGRPRTSQGSAAAWCADLPVRNGLGARAGMRTRTSAHLAGFGGGGVRGPPGPQWAWCQSRNADEDVRAPPRVRRRRGARTSRSAMGFAPRLECGRGRPRTSQGSAAAWCADLPVRNGLGASRNADEDVRAPPWLRWD